MKPKRKIDTDNIEINAPGFQSSALLANLERKLDEYRSRNEYQVALRSIDRAEKVPHFDRRTEKLDVSQLSRVISELEGIVADHGLPDPPFIDTQYKWPMRWLALRFRQVVQDEISWRLPSALKKQTRINEYVLNALRLLTFNESRNDTADE